MASSNINTQFDGEIIVDNPVFGKHKVAKELHKLDNNFTFNHQDYGEIWDVIVNFNDLAYEFINGSGEAIQIFDDNFKDITSISDTIILKPLSDDSFKDENEKEVHKHSAFNINNEFDIRISNTYEKDGLTIKYYTFDDLNKDKHEFKWNGDSIKITDNVIMKYVDVNRFTVVDNNGNPIKLKPYITKNYKKQYVRETIQAYNGTNNGYWNILCSRENDDFITESGLKNERYNDVSFQSQIYQPLAINAGSNSYFNGKSVVIILINNQGNTELFNNLIFNFYSKQFMSNSNMKNMYDDTNPDAIKFNKSKIKDIIRLVYNNYEGVDSTGKPKYSPVYLNLADIIKEIITDNPDIIKDVITNNPDIIKDVITSNPDIIKDVITSNPDIQNAIKEIATRNQT